MAHTLPECSHFSDVQFARLTIKRGIYHFRRLLCVRYCAMKVETTNTQNEITISLKTRDYLRARLLAARLDHAFNRAIDILEPASVPALRQYLQEVLDGDDEQRRNAPPGQSVYSVVGSDVSPDDADRELVQDLLSEARERLANRDYPSRRAIADEILTKHNLPVSQRDPISLAILEAEVCALEEMVKRTEGRARPSWLEEQTTRPAPAQAATSIGPKLSSILPEYVAFAVEHSGWRGQTKAQNKTTFELFIQVCGDMPVSAYSRKEVGDFYGVLIKLPNLYGKAARWRGMKLREIAIASTGEDLPRLTMKTVQRHLSALGGFFKWATERGLYAAANPAHGFSFPKKGKRAKTADTRTYWQGETLCKLFSSPIWMGSMPVQRAKAGPKVYRDDYFWLPLLGLFHGNRLEEFAQLRREDVRCEEGIWLFNINDEGPRQLKNDQSRRRVPIHDELKRIGFLRYVEMIAPAPSDLVFPEMKPGGPDNKLGYYYSKRWTEYRRAVGVYKRLLDYHSFRHGVTTKLFDAEVPRVIVDELTGHEGEGTTQQVYHHGVSLMRLQQAINKVAWPELDLSHLYKD